MVFVCPECHLQFKIGAISVRKVTGNLHEVKCPLCVAKWQFVVRTGKNRPLRG